MISQISLASVKFYQESKVNNNGTVTLTFTYSANTSEIKNNFIGSLPFTKELVNEYFACPTGVIKKNLVYKDPNNANSTIATIDLLVSNLREASKCKALSGITAGWGQMDTGTVFSWLILPAFMQNNSVDTYQFLLSTEGQIKSTNGLIKDNVINWYIYKDKIDPKGAYFLATLKLNPSASTKSDTSKGNTSGQDGKSCGLFGLELPILLLGGLVISKQLRKKK